MDAMLPSMEWRGDRIPRLVAGTAQLGMPYGIANLEGRPERAKGMAVIDMAWESGVRFFDTAQAYGESEGVVGAALRDRGVMADARIITKLNPGLIATDCVAIRSAVQRSVEKLAAPIWALLLHRSDWLDRWDEGLGETLREAQREGFIKYLGASVYSVAEAFRALAHDAMDMVQVPASALDQRMLRGGVFQVAAEQGKLCFARSIFLQGLLTLGADAVAIRLPFAHAAFEAWLRLTRRYGLPPKTLAVRCALAFSAPLVVGMETPAQVRDNAELFALPPLTSDDLEEIQQVMCGVLDERVLNPSKWPED